MKINSITSRISFTKNQNKQNKHSLTVRQDFAINKITADSVTFTSKPSLDINNDEQLIDYVQKSLGDLIKVDDDFCKRYPDFLENFRNFLSAVPDIENNPPEFKLTKKSDSTKNKQFILSGIQKGNRFPQYIWNFNAETITDPFEIIDIQKKNLLITYDEKSYKNIHKGIKLYYQDIFSMRSYIESIGKAEQYGVSMEYLYNFLNSNSKDKPLIQKLNSKSPNEIYEYCRNSLLNIKIVADEYHKTLDLFVENNNPFGLKNTIRSEFKDQSFNVMVRYWMDLLGERNPDRMPVSQIVNRLIKADSNPDEKNKIIFGTVNQILRANDNL